MWLWEKVKATFRPEQDTTKRIKRWPAADFASFNDHLPRFSLKNQGEISKMACRFGACDLNNNGPKAKKSAKKAKKVRKNCCAESGSEWSDSGDSCSGCSACNGSSSTCSCSECDMETDDSCQSPACDRENRKPTKKNGKALMCRNGACEWVSQKKAKKLTKTKKAAEKKTNGKSKKMKSSRNCC